MKYFGDPAINPKQLTEKVPVPVGELCSHCDERIKPNESGIAFGNPSPRLSGPQHDYCFMRSVVGSVGHQLGLCTCNDGPGKLEDPKYMTRHQAAIAAYQTFDILRQNVQLERIQPSTSRSIEVGMKIGRLLSPGNLSVMDVFGAMRGFPVLHPESRQLNARDLVVLEALCEVWEGTHG